MTIATLNDDTLVEKILTNEGLEFTDGFGPSQDGVRYFDPTLFDSSRKIPLLKVHGSVNWFRLRPDDGDWTEDEVGIFEQAGFDRFRRPDGRLQISEQRPMLLIGTFNKSIRYTDWFFSEIFSQFQQSLKVADTLVISGYGFGDKGINSQISQWTPHRIVIVHPDPEKMKQKARGAMQRAFDYLESKGRLYLVPKRADEAQWEEVRSQSRRPANATALLGRLGRFQVKRTVKNGHAAISCLSKKSFKASSKRRQAVARGQ
ncbi:MAG: SIR2 family protein, partial [Vicinamibacteria bacterium]